MTRFGGMSRNAIRADGSTNFEKIPEYVSVRECDGSGIAGYISRDDLMHTKPGFDLAALLPPMRTEAPES
jgi:hypothetical protein